MQMSNVSLAVYTTRWSCGLTEVMVARTKKGEEICSEKKNCADAKSMTLKLEG